MANLSRTSACALSLLSNRLPSWEERLGIAVFCLSLLIAGTQSLYAHEFTAGPIKIEHPWSRAIPQGAKVAAGYFKLSNAGDTPDRLVSATAEIAGRVEIHELAVDAKGIMTMRPLPDGVEVPAGGKVALEPGAYHIMFMDLKAAPIEGKPFKGTLTFEKAGTVTVEYAVEPIGGGAKGHDHSTMHQGG